MTRISTYAANQSALMDLMRAQKNMFDAQQQLSSGKLATDLKGIGYQAESLSASRAALERAKSYEEAAMRTGARLEAQNIALEQMGDAVSNLRTSVTSKEGDYIMHQVREAFYEITNALNTKHSGVYLFGGTRSDVTPVNVSNLSDLVPLASANDVFENNQRTPVVQLDQGYTLDVGMLASDVGGEVMAAFKRIADFDAGANGPFASPLTAAQDAFLTSEIQNVITALDNLYVRVGENGSKQTQVENLKNSHVDRQDFLTLMISDIEDADMAEAANRFQQAQTAVDVSAVTFSTLNDVSLLPYLR
ncbi:flagellin [Maricaulis parjimensis]|uniref:flagellin n=1 Tax=Maricaulis parjimensis TaxID=144023 RepID=UPI00193A2F8A|nr:flagellin [Maricaulis parjimensis]